MMRKKKMVLEKGEFKEERKERGSEIVEREI